MDLFLFHQFIELDKGDCKVDLIDDALVRCMNSACDGGRTSFTIDTDGSIYPCLAAAGVSEFVIGSVDNGINHESVERILEWAQARYALVMSIVIVLGVR